MVVPTDVRNIETGEQVDGFARVVETHTGVVFFLGDKAYKLKKPVSFGFVDFSRREARQQACYREVELNARLSPDVYLGVADVVGPEGSLCDHMVVMKRLPDERRLSRLAMANRPVGVHLDRLAALLAGFHRRAARSIEIDAAATRDAVLNHWESNDREMGRLIGLVFDPEILAETMRLARRYLAGRAALFGARATAGRVCDGHGDLLADDIFCLDDGPRVLDCLEFDDELRYGDVLADIAFLVMDLERLGRADLGRTFTRLYREASGDSWPVSLEHHYVAYRAQVRALVNGLRSIQGDAEAGSTARLLVGLAARHLRAGRARLVVVGGLPGAGKSTLASRLAEAIDAVLLRSDEIRKKLAGLEPTESAAAAMNEGLYRPEVTDLTYAEMLRHAGESLSLGQSVVLDATFSNPRWREAAGTLATRTVADLDELQCVAPFEVLTHRVADRAARTDVSDASIDILRHLSESEIPWPHATLVDTNRPCETVEQSVLELLGASS